jgi:hypothetical protein
VFVEGPGGLTQIHDFNPGIAENGLFWVKGIPLQNVETHDDGRASMHAEDLEVEDYHDLVNALLDGPSDEAECSFRIEWAASSDRHHFRYEPDKWESKVRLTTAQAWWKAESEFVLFETDAIETSHSLFAEVGMERSGVFFS